MWELWLALGIGVIARWYDRVNFVISEEEGRTIGGFIRKNWMRMAIRAGLTCWVFWKLVQWQEISTELHAVAFGISADVAVESFLDRAKAGSEKVMQKLKKEGGD